LESGRCSIYGNHPEDPCKVFKCEWLVNDNIPGWMKPDDVNAILVWRKEDNIDYLDIAEAGEKLRVECFACRITTTCNIGLMAASTGLDQKVFWVKSSRTKR
jgi:hypothetical protein